MDSIVDARESVHAAMRGFRAGTRRGLSASCAAAALLALTAPGAAPAQDQEDNAETIVVTGTRIQRSGMETPTPVTVVSAAELDNLNPGQVVDSLSQLPQFFGNQRPQTTGFPSSAGSNLNLRGAGATRTLVLLDGRRVPNGNRFGTVNVSSLPEGAIRSVETVTGGASAQYGTDAVAGVVNFILDTDFDGFEGHAQGGMTSRGDGENWEVGATYGMPLGDRAHLLVSADMFQQEAIWSLESLQDRDWFRQRALISGPVGGPTFITRDFVSQTNMSVGGVINQPGSALNKLEFFNNNGVVSTQPLAFSGVGALQGGCNCQAEAQRDPTWGMDADNAIQNENKRENLFAYADLDVTDTLNIYAQGMYGGASVKGPWFSNPILIPPVWQATIFSGNPYLPANVQTTMNTEGLASFGMGLVGDNQPGNPLGQYTIEQEDDLKSGTLGFTYEPDFGGFLEGWRMRGYAQYGQNDQITRFENGIRMDHLPLALDAVINPNTGQVACRAAVVNPTLFGDCVPVNMFGGPAGITPEAAAYIVDPEKLIETEYKQYTAEFIIDGEIYEGWGAGPILMAAGASYRKDEIHQAVPDLTDEFVFLNGVNTGFRGLIPEDLPNGMPGVRPGSVPPGFQGASNLAQVLFTGSYQTPDTVLAGSFDVPEVFVELNAPLLSDLPLIQHLETNLAFRHADYSGSGGIDAWKYGLSWQVIDDLRLRATSSRDVRAATLRERFDATAGGANVTDPVNGNALVGTASRSGGNPNVLPEIADTITGGFVYQPSFLDGFSVSLDYYDIDIEGALGQLGFQAIVDGCFAGSADLCQYILRDSNNQIVRIDSLFINIANQHLRGLDLEARYTMDVAGGDLTWRLLATQILEDSLLFPGAPRQTLDEERPSYRVAANVGYSRGPWSAFVNGQYLDERALRWNFVEGVSVDDNTVDSVFVADVNFQYDFQVGEKDVGLFFNVNNVFDQEPPQVPTTPGFVGGTAGPTDATLYDNVGRRWVVGARLRF